MTEPGRLVSLSRVFSRDEAGPHGGPRGALRGVDLELRAGLHVVLGRPEDGTAALVELLAGDRPPRSGSVRIGGRDPARSPALRSRLGVVGPRDALSDETVAGCVARAAMARGEGADALARLGLASLASRRVASLSVAERRSVELAIALASARPLVVALFEPLAACIVERALLFERLAAIARDGAAVVLTASSYEDLLALEATTWCLAAGRLVGVASLLEVSGGELSVWLRDPDASAARALALELCGRQELMHVAWRWLERESASIVTVGARDLDLAALAVAEVAASQRAPVLAISPASGHRAMFATAGEVPRGE